jgi:predicted nucleotidyltransferase
MNDIDLGLLANGPHAALIRDIAHLCAADASIQAIWVGGSLASGRGDAHSDVDFRVAVEPGMSRSRPWWADEQRPAP